MPPKRIPRKATDVNDEPKYTEVARLPAGNRDITLGIWGLFLFAVRHAELQAAWLDGYQAN